MKKYLGLSLIALALLTGCSGGGSGGTDTGVVNGGGASTDNNSTNDTTTKNSNTDNNNTADNNNTTDNNTIDSNTTDNNTTDNNTTDNNTTDNNTTDNNTTDNNSTGDTGSSYTVHPYDAPPVSESDKQAFLDAVNEERSQPRDCGEFGVMPAVPPLVWDDRLYSAAYEHNEDMATADFYSHDGSGAASDWTSQVQELGRGSTVQERADNNGYPGGAGENIWASPKTLQEAMAGWMESDHHCQNIMTEWYKTLGLSHYVDDNSRWIDYWTMDLGAD